ncbi:MAG: pantetheine-phosphate adenylyltransferase [Candidatus Marinimicrobia bacterium]|nr:pantetheine-phosphate adenylyltransferase [Candidatus Neomarinimicrobiota bacterium]MCH8067680.1 pantetheine-phosphate adenylyltransferase [Candidatus Neomarinimicrobiota bacterium]
MIKAIYPGTFDPITMGHLDIIERSCKLFEKIYVTVAVNQIKSTVFTLDERLDMIRKSTEALSQVEVTYTSGLIVDYAKKKGATVLIRGLRFVSDFEIEFQMSWMNRHLNEEIITVFVMPHGRYTHLNSTVIREVAQLGGDIEKFVPPIVLVKLKEKFQN